MNMLLEASNLQELKQSYKKLANMFHPDRGGDSAKMQRINAVYKHCILKFKNLTQSDVEEFESIRAGAKLYVNGTPCEVIDVRKESFRVVAIGRTRQAVFDKKTGIGKYNKRLRASFSQEKYCRS